jgi:hypothetical protein
MIEGLWIVQYEGLQGNGAGVAVFVNGRVLGGDMGVHLGGHLHGRERLSDCPGASQQLPTQHPELLGVVGDFDLQIQAPLRGNVIQGAMSLLGRPNMSIVVRLTKKANL